MCIMFKYYSIKFLFLFYIMYKIKKLNDIFKNINDVYNETKLKI
jgi:hypothetical protein